LNAFVQAVHDASAIHGELKRMILAIGMVGLIIVFCWVMQEFGARKSMLALGWFGIGSLCVTALTFCALVIAGFL
jgi:hypothetical protein